MVMLTPEKVLVLLPKEKVISIIDLSKKIEQKVAFEFKKKIILQTFKFSNSQLICLCELQYRQIF